MPLQLPVFNKHSNTSQLISHTHERFNNAENFIKKLPECGLFQNVLHK